VIGIETEHVVLNVRRIRDQDIAQGPAAIGKPVVERAAEKASAKKSCVRHQKREGP